MTNLNGSAILLEKGLLTNRQKKISAESIIKVLQNIDDINCSVSWCSANWINNGQGSTHVLLAVKLGNCVFIGFAEGSVQRSSPGRAWAELKPWDLSTSTLKDKLIKWTSKQNIKIQVSDITLFSNLVKQTKLSNFKAYETDKNVVIKEQIIL